MTLQYLTMYILELSYKGPDSIVVDKVIDIKANLVYRYAKKKHNVHYIVLLIKPDIIIFYKSQLKRIPVTNSIWFFISFLLMLSKTCIE